MYILSWEGGGGGGGGGVEGEEYNTFYLKIERKSWTNQWSLWDENTLIHVHVYVPRILKICAISKLRCAFWKLINCVINRSYRKPHVALLLFL